MKAVSIFSLLRAAGITAVRAPSVTAVRAINVVALRSASAVALRAVSVTAAFGLAACNGSGGFLGLFGYSIGGTVSGLAANQSITLTNNATDSLTINSNGSFKFGSSVAAGGSYSVTVTTPPAGQLCTVSGGSGTNVTANISTVSVACSNVTQYAYVVNSTGKTISQYSISANGALTPLSPATVATGNSPRSVTVDSVHHSVYVTNLSDNTVSQYAIQKDGTLTPNAVPTVATGHSPWALTIDPLAKFAYVANSADGTISQYSITSTGALDALAVSPVTTGSAPWNITISPDGKYAYVSNHGTSGNGGRTLSQYAIAPDTGMLSALNPPTVISGTFPSGAAIDATSTYVYVTNAGDNTISQYSIGSTGDLSSLTPSTVGAGNQPVYIAIDPSNKFVYATNITPGAGGGPNPKGTVSQYTLGTTGLLTPMATASVATGAGPWWLTFDLQGQFAYVVNTDDNTVSEYTLGTSGTLTPLGTIATGSSPLQIAIAVGSP